ncbi:TerD family protein [Sporocytophaga myxococcoides]|uniref:TerD family protein n=1 Tax=Sporocytophaga myxococcoides TaxID=153721 RepID=UPI0003F7DF1E|nr:TerD family protein [Sporocytophaga myxococcoides]
MSINLKKGNSFNLTKNQPGLKKIMIGLGWEYVSQRLDLDASVFMNGKNGKLLSDEYFVFYNNLTSPDGCIKHTGDNRTGVGDDDDELVLANMDLINPSCEEMVIAVSIHDAEIRKHHYGMLADAYIRIFDVETQTELLRYDLDAEFGGNTAVVFGTLTKKNNEWHFTATGTGNNKGLQGLIDIYA